jgi:hypothetical protein
MVYEVQQTHGADRSQPFRRVTIRVSAAAGSGGSCWSLGAMGHHLFIHDQRSLPMRDGDVALVRHFLIEAARQLGDEPLASAINGWQYQGPGVWVGIDETLLAGLTAVFPKGIEAAESLGDQIAVDYLNREVQLPGGRWLKPQATSDVAALIRALEDHLRGRT